jgi:hypothetical protein
MIRLRAEAVAGRTPAISPCQRIPDDPDYGAMSQTPPCVSRTPILMAALTVVPLLLATNPALAGNRRAQERAARKACLNGDFAKGVSILSDLFVDTKDPNYIFNQGRCFEQNRRYAEAAARFEEYLRVPGAQLGPEDRASAEKHIADCQEKIAKERGDSPIPPAPQPVVAPAPAVVPQPSPQPAIAEPPASVVVLPAPEPVPARRRWGLVTAGIITGVVGVGGLVAGVVYNLKANGTVNDMETTVGGYTKAKSDDANTDKTVALVGYVAGGACVVAGAILVAVGAAKSTPGSSTRVALLPTVGPGQVGAMLTGGF